MATIELTALLERKSIVVAEKKNLEQQYARLSETLLKLKNRQVELLRLLNVNQGILGDLNHWIEQLENGEALTVPGKEEPEMPETEEVLELEEAEEEPVAEEQPKEETAPAE